MSKKDYLKDFWNEEEDNKNSDSEEEEDNKNKIDYKKFIIDKKDKKIKNIIIEKKIEIEIPSDIQSVKVKELIPILKNL